ncbi:37S ribosomal protein, mitochondrial [Myotisia sp. PD_48]|nr:37S ribosomal protein, mitochondrial [Myotisia sp. PD_48]
MILRTFSRRQARIAFQSCHPRPFTFQTRFLSSNIPELPRQIPTAVAERQLDEADEVLDLVEGSEPPLPPGWGQYQDKVKTRNEYNNRGSEIRGVYRPEHLLKDPPRASNVTLELLLASQSHLGHSTSLWNPANSSYIYGIREGIHIISLEVTAAHLRRAAKIVQDVAKNAGLILFVGTRRGQRRAVVRAAELAGGYHVVDRWIPGSLTNAQQILGRCEMKVVDAMDREVKVEGFRPSDTNRAVLRPDLVVCFNPKENEPLLQECAALNILTIGVIDTDADPTRVAYQIPANDDSLRCITVIAGVLGRAGEEGKKQRLELAATGKLPYTPVSMEDIVPEKGS